MEREGDSEVLPLLKKHIRLGHAGIGYYSVDLLIPDFKKVLKKKKKKRRRKERTSNIK